ncbi:MAG: hypothetical protein AB7R77_12545, partial [Ilumatobacteraceae bacterium]
TFDEPPAWADRTTTTMTLTPDLASETVLRIRQLELAVLEQAMAFIATPSSINTDAGAKLANATRQLAAMIEGLGLRSTDLDPITDHLLRLRIAARSPETTVSLFGRRFFLRAEAPEEPLPAQPADSPSPADTSPASALRPPHVTEAHRPVGGGLIHAHVVGLDEQLQDVARRLSALEGSTERQTDDVWARIAELAGRIDAQEQLTLTVDLTVTVAQLIEHSQRLDALEIQGAARDGEIESIGDLQRDQLSRIENLERLARSSSEDFKSLQARPELVHHQHWSPTGSAT